MMANIELMKRLRTRFLRMRHKQHFNMKPIAAKTDCGTAMCIAGHTLDLAGYKMRLDPNSDIASDVYEGRNDFEFIAPNGKVVTDPLIAAAKELGMRPGFSYEEGKTDAYDLFHDFSLKTPRDAADRIGELIEEYS